MSRFAIRLTLALLVASFAVSGATAEQARLASLDWDDKIEQSVRSGISTALWKERDKLQGEKNDAGESYIRVFTNSGVESVDGNPSTYVTIQRCLEDKMVTELWRYSFEKKGNDYEITKREKIASDDTAVYVRYESTDKTHATQPFTFEHDLLELELGAGKANLGYLGDKVSMLGIEASGRLVIEPLNDHEKQYFVRMFDAPRLSAQVEAVGIMMDPRNTEFIELAGLTGELGKEPTGPAANSAVDELFDHATDMISDKGRYTPYRYDWMPLPEQKDTFYIRVKTVEYGWITYRYDPNDPMAIWVLAEDNSRTSMQIMGIRQKFVTLYPEPKVRELPTLVRESQPQFAYTAPHRYDAMFDVDADRFIAKMDIDLLLLESTQVLTFNLGGNPSIRYVRTADDEPLMTVPILSAGSTKYGFEETANTFRVMLPRVYEKGEKIRLRIAYESPKLVRKIEESFWTIARGGFLPFFKIIYDPAHCRFIIRTKDAYEHIALGERLHEEVADGYRYSEWGSQHTFNFPTMIIGQYFEPIVEDADGVSITGYMPKTTQRVVQSGNAAFRPHVEMAKNSARVFSRLFKAEYPFEAMKVISAPQQFSWAQAPSSMIYVGELFLMSDAEVASWMGANPSEFRGTTVHEVSHQWWGGRVSNVNGYHYWWVEGLAEMSTAMYRRIAEGESAYNLKLLDWYDAAMATDWTGSLIDFQYHNEGIPTIPMHYTKGPMVFHMLSVYFSRGQLMDILEGIMEKHAGDLISTADVQRVAEETLGVGLQWYFDDWVRTNGIPEVTYKINEPEQAEDGQGWIITGSLQQVVKRRNEVIPGRYFENLLVPISVHLRGEEPHLQRVIMEGPSKEFRFRVESRPGRITINENKEMLIETKRM